MAKIGVLCILGVVIICLSGWICQTLWNWLMPEIFGIAEIDFWQALGLMALSSCFFYRGSGRQKGD